MPHVQLYWLRHGATDWNEQGLIQGRTDRPLLDSTRESLKNLQLPPPLPVLPVTASPLSRARETALLLTGREPKLESRLIERAFGEHEGKPAADVIREPVPPSWGWETIDEAPAKGETLREVRTRLESLLRELGAAGEDRLLVTHKGVLYALISLASGWEGGKKPPARPKDGHYHLTEVDKNGAIVAAHWNLPLESPAP